MSHQKTEIEKADLIGGSLVTGAIEAAKTIMEELDTGYNVKLRDRASFPQFLGEVIVIFMHVADRLAFAHLGFERGEIFVDRLAVAVVKEVLVRVNPELSANFCNVLHDTYNLRQTEYGRYGSLFPERDEALKNTLFWEASGVLFAYMDTQNPVDLVFLNGLLVSATNAFLTDISHVQEVLQS